MVWEVSSDKMLREPENKIETYRFSPPSPSCTSLGASSMPYGMDGQSIRAQDLKRLVPPPIPKGHSHPSSPFYRLLCKLT